MKDSMTSIDINAVVKMAVALALSDRFIDLLNYGRFQTKSLSQSDDSNVSADEAIIIECLLQPHNCSSQFVCNSEDGEFNCNYQAFHCLERYDGCLGQVFRCKSYPGTPCNENFSFLCISEDGFGCLSETFLCVNFNGQGTFRCTDESGSTTFDCDSSGGYDFSCGDLPGGSSSNLFDCNDESDEGFDCNQKHIFNCNSLFVCRSGHDCSGGVPCSSGQGWNMPPNSLPDAPTGGVFSCISIFTCNANDEQSTSFSCRARSMFSCGRGNQPNQGFECGQEGGDSFNCGIEGTGKFYCADSIFHCGKCTGPQPPYYWYFYLFQCDISNDKFECNDDIGNFECPEKFDCMSTQHACSQGFSD